jgi:hypothetical protein
MLGKLLAINVDCAIVVCKVCRCNQLQAVVMATKEEIARKRAEKAQAKAREALRLAQAAEKTLSEIERNADTQRKILEGVTSIYACAHSEEYRRLHEQFRLKALTLNKDRQVFGLPLLPVEGERRGRRKADSANVDNKVAVASATLADGSADAPAQQVRESEAA